MGSLRRGLMRIAILSAMAASTAGCQTIRGGPDRLYSVEEEVALAREWVERSINQYYSTGQQTENLRNEIIARRMYIIDVEYSQFEISLTRERQEVGFLSSTVSQGLNVAGALFTPAQTTKLLSGLAGGVGSIRGYYDSEIVIAKTIQIVQGHMRHLRDTVSNKIRSAMAEPVSRYPLALALSDLEEYYRAGTFSAGLIEALGNSGAAAAEGAAQKSNLIEINFGSDPSTQTPIEQYLRAEGATGRRALNNILRNPPLNSNRRIPELLFDGSPAAIALRGRLIGIARGTIPNFPR